MVSENICHNLFETVVVVAQNWFDGKVLAKSMLALNLKSGFQRPVAPFCSGLLWCNPACPRYCKESFSCHMSCAYCQNAVICGVIWAYFMWSVPHKMYTCAGHGGLLVIHLIYSSPHMAIINRRQSVYQMYHGLEKHDEHLPDHFLAQWSQNM